MTILAIATGLSALFVFALSRAAGRADEQIAAWTEEVPAAVTLRPAAQQTPAALGVAGTE